MKGPMSYLVFVVILTIMKMTQGSRFMCKSSRDVRYSGIEFDCRKCNLENIPAKFPEYMTTAKLNDNKLNIVRNFSFNSVKKLRSLDLKNSQITRLEPMAFQSCEKLLYLDLSSNNLSLTMPSFPDQVFDALINLRWLDMKLNYPNNKGSYPERIFKYLKVLEFLTLDAFDEPEFGDGIGTLYNLKSLVLRAKESEMKMLKLKNSTFRPFRNVNLEALCIEDGSAEVFQTGVFAPLTKLQNLSLINVHVGVKKALRSLSSFTERTMKKIHFHKINKQSHRQAIYKVMDGIINKTDLFYLANICVEKFILSNNLLLFLHLIEISNSSFAQCVTHVDISGNNLYIDPLLNPLLFTAFQTFLKLKYVDASMQVRDLKPTSKPISSVAKHNPNFHALSTTQCLLPSVTINLPINLKSANFSASTNDFGPIAFALKVRNGKSLQELNVSFIGLTEICGMFDGVDNLNSLDLSGNPKLDLLNSLFQSSLGIERLLMNDFSFQQHVVFNQGKQLFKPLSKLKFLHISNNRLSDLPHDLFNANSQLQYLDLSGNIFHSILFSLSLTPELSTLDMTYNSIGLLDASSRQQVDLHIDNTGIHFKLFLHGNLFACGCGSLELLFWLEETRATLDDDGNYTCLLADGIISNTASEVRNSKRLWRKCVGFNLLHVSFSLLTLLFALLLCVMLVKTNKTALLYFFLNILRQEIPKSQRQSFKCDLYASC